MTHESPDTLVSIAQLCREGVSAASRVMGSLGAPRWSRLFVEPSVLPQISRRCGILGTTNRST